MTPSISKNSQSSGRPSSVSNPWKKAVILTAISQSPEIKAAIVTKKFTQTRLGYFQFLRDLPKGIDYKFISGHPDKFPPLEDRQILACHVDLLSYKPLIACFTLEQIREIEDACQREHLANRNWVVLTISEELLE